MWFFLFVLLLVPQFHQSASQTSATSERGESLYARALSASLDEIVRRWGQIDDGLSGVRMRTDWKNIIVEKFPEITDGMPTRLADVGIEYVDARELIERYGRVRRPFSIFIAHPMTTEGTRLKVWYSIAWFEYRKGKPQYEFSDWSIVYFSYDSSRQRYIVDEVRLGSI